MRLKNKVVRAAQKQVVCSIEKCAAEKQSNVCGRKPSCVLEWKTGKPGRKIKFCVRAENPEKQDRKMKFCVQMEIWKSTPKTVTRRFHF